MSLTIKQENFCLAYIETGNASEAYRRAFNTKNTSERVINNKASEMIKRDDIRVRLEELRRPAIEAAQITLEDHLNDLKRLRDAAWESEKYGPAIQAEVARGKASGFYIERVESGNPGDFDKLGDDELERSIEEAARAIDSARTKSKAPTTLTRATAATKSK